jgi:serine/threonine-protein kinase
VDVSDDGRLFQMMELVEGETLESHLARRAKLSPHAAARLGAVLAEALSAAHGAGVVHRDVKPGNVMLTRASPGLKLLDFGISTLREAHATGGPAEDGILGTPAFLSPEQVTSPGVSAAPADVYALGILLFLCLAGRLPFADAEPQSSMLAHVARAPLDLAACQPGLDPALSGAVMACLHKAPDERPSASALAGTLSKIADAAGTPPLEALGLVRAAGPEREAAENVAPTVKC